LRARRSPRPRKHRGRTGAARAQWPPQRSALRFQGSPDLLPHVDLAGHRSGDEGHAEFLEAVNGGSDVGDEGVDAGSFTVKIQHDGLLFAGRWARDVNVADRVRVQIELRPQFSETL